MKKRFLIVILSIISFLFLTFLFTKFLELINFKCIYKYYFNLYCAGCGATRLIKSIFSLDFYQAFRYNPLLFILFIIGLFYFFIYSIKYIKTGYIKKINIKFFIFLAFILLLYMLLRNLPGFEYLLPTKI